MLAQLDQVLRSTWPTSHEALYLCHNYHRLTVWQRHTTQSYKLHTNVAHLCSIRNCAMSSRFVRCHMASSRCIESTSSCKKSISLPSGLAALVRVCIEPRRRSISRPASSRSLRRPASHSWCHQNETCNQIVSAYFIDIRCWRSTMQAV